MSETQMLLDGFVAPKIAPDNLAQYDWIVLSSSAGKDSMAMQSLVCERAKAEGVLDRVVTVHANLGRVEWKGTSQLAEAQAAHHGTRYIEVWRRQSDLLEHIESRGMFPGPDTRYCTAHHKQNQVSRVLTQLTDEAKDADESIAARSGDLLEQIEERGMFPDAKRRYCTSDQKRAQIAKVYTVLTEAVRQGQAEPEPESGALTPRDGDLLEQIEHIGFFPRSVTRYCTSDHKRDQIKRLFTSLTTMSGKKRPVRILSCLGMRADESPARAKKPPFVERDKAESNGKRHVDKWLPIHKWTEAMVWEHIDNAGLRPLVHPAYALGMPRLSCCFCIFAPKAALVLAGKHNPELLDEYVRVEAKIGHKFRVNLSMAEVKAAIDANEATEPMTTWTM